MDQFSSWAKIVIVEDNTSLADIYKIRLEMLGYICFVAYDGEVGLQLIEREKPSLVLLDLMVPKIAGDQILERMRASDWGKDIKVLIISNLNEADAPAGLREKGIEGYAVKANLSNDQLDKLVDDILKPAGQTEALDLDDPSVVQAAPVPVASEPAFVPPQPSIELPGPTPTQGLSDESTPQPMAPTEPAEQQSLPPVPMPPVNDTLPNPDQPQQ